MKRTISIKTGDIGQRLDSVISRHLKEYTRSQIKKWIVSGNVTIDGNVRKASSKVRSGDVIDVKIKPPKLLKAKPQKIPLEILYEDHDIVVVDKPAGLVVHPAPGNPDNTLVNALLHHCSDLSGIGGYIRPGIVHRLDKGTSGVMVVAKNDFAHNSLANQFKERAVKKIYLAVIYGGPRADKGVFDAEIGRHPKDRKRMSTKTRRGRKAVTEWKVLDRFGKDASLVEIRLMTGRTHQIRVHFSSHGMPLIGDDVYGGKKTLKRFPDGRMRNVARLAVRPMLHAKEISFRHPRSGKTVTFGAQIPEDFAMILEGFREILS